uniref:Uncharacterized protein n=1 Tax=Heterosigma akashiwo TaxID=2829 RepID=A0A7S4D545_HETAK|mmetsp:Transcript_25979/g.40248  ORF Transcript_25979/g.40248 Transcript_25979/m.40248 type:complete len:111 (+) Transcript_25979:155-487(+)
MLLGCSALNKASMNAAVQFLACQRATHPIAFRRRGELLAGTRSSARRSYRPRHRGLGLPPSRLMAAAHHSSVHSAPWATAAPPLLHRRGPPAPPRVAAAPPHGRGASYSS